MATYNSARLYNHKITDGGANYNSAPFIIVISDSAIGQDFISMQANISVSDVAEGFENIGVAGAFFSVDSNRYLQPLGVLVIGDSRYELLPATRDITEEIPGRHGEIDFGVQFTTRLLELHVATDEGNSSLQKAHLKRLFASYLDPTKGEKTLIFLDDMEKTYLVKYSGKIDVTEYPTWFEFTIPFKMSNPFIIGTFEKTLIGNGVLINDGTFETPLIIEISGPVTNPSVIIGTDTLTYTGTISSGQTLIINTENETVKIGNTNAMAGYNGIFPTLLVGSTNVTAVNNVLIRWRDRWL